MKTIIDNIVKQRGKFLTLMIIFLVIGDVQIPYYLVNSNALKAVYGNLPPWYPLYVVFSLALNIAIIIGMWKMKKWSVYLLIVYFATKIPTELFMFRPVQQVATFATTLVGAGLWFWAIYRKWSLFD
jgi:hypothetical protein